MRRCGVVLSQVLCLASMFVATFSSSASAQTVEATFSVGSQPCAVAINVFTNQIIEAIELGAGQWRMGTAGERDFGSPLAQRRSGPETVYDPL